MRQSASLVQAADGAADEALAAGALASTGAGALEVTAGITVAVTPGDAGGADAPVGPADAPVGPGGPGGPGAEEDPWHAASTSTKLAKACGCECVRMRIIETKSCGAEGDRTPDLIHAMDALSQLSYGPKRIPG